LRKSVLDDCSGKQDFDKEVEKLLTKELFLTTLMDALEVELNQFKVEVSELKEYVAKLLKKVCQLIP